LESELQGKYNRPDDPDGQFFAVLGESFAMNPWFAKTLILAASIAMVVIRAPHGQAARSRWCETAKGGLKEYC
jgi:hypothetical protein